MNILKTLFCLFFSSSIYVLAFGNYELIPINEIKDLAQFILTGKFVIPLIIFFSTWHFFYTICDFILSRNLIKWSHRIATIVPEIPKTLSSPKMQSQRFAKGALNWAVKLLLQTSIIRIEKNQIFPGHAFHRALEMVEKVEKNEDDIDTGFVMESVIVIFQALATLALGMFYWGINLPIWFLIITIGIGLIAIIIFWALALLGVSLRIYSKPIKEKMTKFQEQATKSSQTTPNDANEVKDELALKEKEQVEILSDKSKGNG
ncbi:MAG: hypothetical protein HY842_05550 [Bacteroidetes bacterium]|nr:hypothetical protein [Bacteroidota bacterium]